MIFDQLFAYLSAISLLESTEKKKKEGYLHVIPQKRSKHCGRNTATYQKLREGVPSTTPPPPFPPRWGYEFAC